MRNFEKRKEKVIMKINLKKKHDSFLCEGRKKDEKEF